MCAEKFYGAALLSFHLCYELTTNPPIAIIKNLFIFFNSENKSSSKEYLLYFYVNETA